MNGSTVNVASALEQEGGKKLNRQMENTHGYRMNARGIMELCTDYRAKYQTQYETNVTSLEVPWF